MKRKAAWCIAGGLAALLLAGWIRSFAGAPSDPQDRDQDDEEEAVQAPSRVTVINGETVLKLGPEVQARMGVAVAALRSASERRLLTVPAVVLSAQGLATERQGYITIQNRLRKAQISEALARGEYQRMETLYRDQQNASRKNRDEAQSAFRSDQADAQSAQQELNLQAAAIRLSWGDRMAQWVADDSSELERILNQREVLVEVTIPAEYSARAAPRVVLEPVRNSPGAATAAAHLISVFSRVDPRVQGTTFLYATANRPGLVPGINLAARVPSGEPERGVVIPDAAVTWWQGRAWVYQQTAPGEFVRRPVPTSEPAEGGYLATGAFKAGEKVAVQGVQALLSEEFRSRLQPQD